MQADVTVIGGGPGGYVAAIRAAQKGASVVLVEDEDVGGVCLNHGCIPTKALKRSAETVREIKRSGDIGVEVDNFAINFSKMADRKDRIVRRLTGGVEHLLKTNGVETINGEGQITQNKEVLVRNDEGNAKIESEHIIISTGSKPLLPGFADLKKEGIVTSRELLQTGTLPDSLAVVGGGYIGVEFASIFSELGVEVHLIEMLPGLMPNMDQDLSDSIEDVLSEKLVTLATETTVESIAGEGENLVLNLSNEENLTVQKVLMATGREPNPPVISDKLNINFDEQGAIKTNRYLQTDEDNIYAIGDVNGKYQLAHVASHEGLTAVANIFDQQEKMNYDSVPAVVFSSPEISSVGMTEKEAEKKTEIEVGRFPYRANGKALADEESDGFVKVIADKKWDEILGIHVFGHRASTMIAEGSLALKLECTSAELAKTIHAHPTLPEMIMEAAEDVKGAAIHKL